MCYIRSTAVGFGVKAVRKDNDAGAGGTPVGRRGREDAVRCYPLFCLPFGACRPKPLPTLQETRPPDSARYPCAAGRDARSFYLKSYRGTSLVKTHPLGSYRRPLPRVPGGVHVLSTTTCLPIHSVGYEGFVDPRFRGVA